MTCSSTTQILQFYLPLQANRASCLDIVDFEAEPVDNVNTIKINIKKSGACPPCPP